MRRHTSVGAVYTRGMLRYRSTLGVSITIAVNARIVRRGAPAVGACFFDDKDRLIYITANPRVRYFHWRRVYTSGRLSQIEYQGFWDWPNRG